jgi:inorganic pyrophosphatase
MKLIDAIVESPKGNTQKFNYNFKKQRFELSKMLPAGMCFPYDFGFIPRTRGEDGDPLDIIIISESASFTGCAIKCRVIGCINGRQIEQDKTEEKNDRYLAVPDVSAFFEKVKSYKDLDPKIIEQLQFFFVHYNELAGKHFELLGLKNAKEAYKAIKSSINKNRMDGAKKKH